MAKPKSDPMFGTPTLRSRGWTDALIRRFLPEPDATAPNPHHRSGPPRKLYLPSRVETVEQSEAFLVAKKTASRRQSAAAKAVETKRSDMRQRLDRLTITVEVLDQDSVITRAIQAFNHRKADIAMDRGWDFEPATRGSSRAFLDRITVNYIRHSLTAYDEHLEDARGRVGVSLAWADVSAKVFAEIARVYPWLANECRRQAEARSGDGATASV